MADLRVKIKDLCFKNPVITASGTYGYGEEFADFVDLNQLGGIIVKGTSLNDRQGNPSPRMAETACGMLNSVGLQNKGVDYFINEIYPKIKNYKTNIIVNISGSSVEEYIKIAEKLNTLDNIPAIELNISCPNVKHGGMEFGTDPCFAKKITQSIRKVYKKILIVKLSPNVTDITAIAKAVEDGGADAISLINTILGMAIDSETQRPLLSTITGGLSGPCIKPVALRMVWQVVKTVDIPVIGIGGISNTSDAIEFILAGASAIQIGTANFIDPQITVKIIHGIEDYLCRHKISSVTELIGAVKI